MHDRCDKVDAHHLNPRYTSSDDGTKSNDKNTYIDDDNNNASKSMVSSDADNDNFAMVLGTPEKSAKN